MSIEQRIWIASLLSALLLFVFAQSVPTNPKKTTISLPDQKSALDVASKEPENIISKLSDSKEVIELESQKIKLLIDKKTASINTIILKNHQDLQTKEPLLFGKKYPLFSIANAYGLNWEFVESSKNESVWRASTQDAKTQNLTIKLNEEEEVFSISLKFDTEAPPTFIATWHRSDQMGGQYNMLETVLKTRKIKPWQREYLKYATVKQRKNVPRGTSITTLSERFFCQSIKPASDILFQAELLPVDSETIGTQLVPISGGNSKELNMVIYVGPRDFFKLRDVGFEQAFPLGTLAKIGLMLMTLLNWIASVVRNYGTAVIILSALITCALAPFTLLGFRSMKKLQELQPKLEQIKQKYAKDPQKVNQAMLELFREHKVSPLGGCLPMLLQLPIFFALWSAITHVIELRGEKFLWIKDLSLPDRLAKLPGGLDLNLLPILVAIVMYIQTKSSQSSLGPQSPNMKLLQGPFMPILFGVMFYGVPSGLVLYWFTNSVFSLAIYRLAKT